MAIALGEFILEIPEFAPYYNSIFDTLHQYLLDGTMCDVDQLDEWIQLVYGDVTNKMKEDDKISSVIMLIWMVVIYQKKTEQINHGMLNRSWPEGLYVYINV